MRTATDDLANTSTASEMAARDGLIKLRNVGKCYHTKAGFSCVLQQVNLDIAEGEFVSIMGPSGAGKSTLLGILGLYDYLWEGDYFLSDFPVHRLPAKERSLLNKRFIGFVFQQFHLLDDLTVAENLDIPLSYRNIPRSERQGMVAGLRSSHHPPARRLGGKTMNLSMANP